MEIICMSTHPFHSSVKGWIDAVHLRAGSIHNRRDVWYRCRRKLSECHIQHFDVKHLPNTVLK